jgi:hypothetical protein
MKTSYASRLPWFLVSLLVLAGCSAASADPEEGSPVASTGGDGGGAGVAGSSAAGHTGGSDAGKGGAGGSGGKSSSGGGGSDAGKGGAGGAGGSGGSGGQVLTGVTVTPASATVITNASRYFACTVANDPSAGCTWNVSEANGGTIDAAGLYVAPAAQGTFHVVATSSKDPSASATATVTVTAPVGGCSGLAAKGTWENITPPQLDSGNWCIPGSASCTPGQKGTYGVNQFALDPNHPGTIFLGTAGFGIWKSTNCGSDWVKINTGKNHEVLDTGRQNTFYVDPANSDILYTMALYGQGLEGFYQSTNGGVDFEQVVTQDVLTVVAGGFFAGVAGDPTDPGHFVAFPHSNCGGTPLPGAALAPDGSWGCLAEGNYANGAWTWKVTTSPFPPFQGDGVWASMVDSKIWLVGGLWRTVTGGVPPVGGGPASAWTKVYPAAGQVAYTGYCYVASTGTIYCGNAQKPLVYSKDKGATWTLSTSPSDVGWSADDGTTLYVAAGNNSYYSSPMSPAAPVGTFTKMSSPPGAVLGGAQIKYDTNYNVLYSSNLTGGFWRVVTK